MEDKEAYVSLMTAQALKRIGFDFPVRSFYQEPLPGTELERLFIGDLEGFRNERHDMLFSLEDWNHTDSVKNDRLYYSCPTLAVAQRWLREVKGYEVDSVSFNSGEGYKAGYIKRESGAHREWLPFSHHTYERALESAINYVIGRIIGEEYDIHIAELDSGKKCL